MLINSSEIVVWNHENDQLLKDLSALSDNLHLEAELIQVSWK